MRENKYLDEDDADVPITSPLPSSLRRIAAEILQKIVLCSIQSIIKGLFDVFLNICYCGPIYINI